MENSRQRTNYYVTQRSYTVSGRVITMWLLTLLALVLSAYLIGCTSDQVVKQDQEVCYEDMSCWNCATMGNKTCGTKLTGETSEIIKAIQEN